MNDVNAKWIKEFLAGECPDYRDRFYSDILNCSDDEMELCHDQVQWMFPLHEESKFAVCYPIVDEEIVEFCKTDENVIENLRKAYLRMKQFYGFDTNDDSIYHQWCRNGDHNLLRITRIIRCLRIFGLNKEAEDFYNCAMKVALRFNLEMNTIKFWKKAYVGKIFESLR